MKILSIFWDMTRINLLNKYNSNNKVTDIDLFLDKIGGTLFTSCYTPAPDTPRSLACMQTGLYPFFNGCNTRVKWPKFFLDPSLKTIFDLLNSKQYKQIFYIPKNNYNTGPFSSRAYEYGYFFHEKHLFQDQLKSKLKSENNVFAHIHLQDYHWCIDDYGANKKGAKEGKKHVVGFTEELLQGVDINDFDYVFIYSDHGHKFRKEVKKENNLMMLNGDRTNILMHVRKKNENVLKKNEKLCSILDLYPTIGEIIKCENVATQGISLFANQEHPYVVIEDHSDFTVKAIQGITRWALKEKSLLYVTEVSKDMCIKDNSSIQITDEEKKAYIKKIAKFSPSIEEYIKMLEVLDYYNTLKSVNQTFSNGKNRIQNNIVRKFNKALNAIFHR